VPADRNEGFGWPVGLLIGVSLLDLAADHIRSRMRPDALAMSKHVALSRDVCEESGRRDICSSVPQHVSEVSTIRCGGVQK
jgi:hypothetical protein